MMLNYNEKGRESFFYKKRNYDSNKDTTITFKGEKEFKSELEQHLKNDYGNINQGLYHICMDYLNTKTTERTIYPIYIDLILPDVDRIEEIEECTITKEESGLFNTVRDRLSMISYSKLEKDDYYYQLYEYTIRNDKFMLDHCCSISDWKEYEERTPAKLDRDGIKYYQLNEYSKRLLDDLSNAKIYRFLLNNYLDTISYDGSIDGTSHKACFQVKHDETDKTFNIIFEYELTKDCTRIINYHAYFVDDYYFEMLIKNNNKMLFINSYPANVFEPNYNPEVQEKLDRIAELQEEKYNMEQKIEYEIKDLQKELIDLL